MIHDLTPARVFGRSGRWFQRALIIIVAPLAIAQAAAPAALPQEAQKVTFNGEEIPAIGFNILSSFEYVIIDAGTGASPEEIELARKKDQIPAEVRQYHDKRVQLTGYLMPLKLEKGLATSFVLMRDVNTCCYGSVPNMNDYVVVTMNGEGVKPVQDIPVDLVGTFMVAEKYEEGYVTSLFEMVGEKFLGPRK